MRINETNTTQPIHSNNSKVNNTTRNTTSTELYQALSSGTVSNAQQTQTKQDKVKIGDQFTAYTSDGKAIKIPKAPNEPELINPNAKIYTESYFEEFIIDEPGVQITESDNGNVYTYTKDGYKYEVTAGEWDCMTTLTNMETGEKQTIISSGTRDNSNGISIINYNKDGTVKNRLQYDSNDLTLKDTETYVYDKDKNLIHTVIQSSNGDYGVYNDNIPAGKYRIGSGMWGSITLVEKKE